MQVPETLDMFCWTRGVKRNDGKYKSIPLSTIFRCIREIPQHGYDRKLNNPYLYFTLESNDKGKRNNMDFKTVISSDCEKWVQALRALLKTSNCNRQRIRKAADEAVRVNQQNQTKSLPVAFDVRGCGDTDVDGIYRTVQRTKNGARLYMSENGHVLSREIIDRKAGWIIGKDQVCFYVSTYKPKKKLVTN